MVIQERLGRLLKHCSADDRICPQPQKWQEFWKLMRAPQEWPPLILNGWVLSTDRQKRERFLSHVKHAASIGLLPEVEAFILSLSPSEWHTCSEDLLDWSYGNALIEDEENRLDRIARARQLYDELRTLSGSSVFDEGSFAETLSLLSLTAYSNIDIRSLAEQLRKRKKGFAPFCEEPYIFQDSKPDIVSEISRLHHVAKIELLLLEILMCIEEPNSEGIVSTARADIEEFLNNVFRED